MTKPTDICSRCGRSYKACKYPISHSHPTVDHVSGDRAQDYNFPTVYNAIRKPNQL